MSFRASEESRHGNFKVTRWDHSTALGMTTSAIDVDRAPRKFRGSARGPRANFSALQFFARDTVRTRSSVLLQYTNTLPTLHPSPADPAAMTTSHRRTPHRSQLTISAASAPNRAKRHRHRSLAGPRRFAGGQNQKSPSVAQNRCLPPSVRGFS